MSDKQRILLVDDDRNISHLIRLYLEKEGFEVCEAARGDEGLAAFKRQAPSLVLLDVMLPEVSGYQIVQDLRADPSLRDVRVLMMTARGSVMERRKGLALGADGFIAKPFDLAELRAEMARVLEGRP